MRIIYANQTFTIPLLNSSAINALNGGGGDDEEQEPITVLQLKQLLVKEIQRNAESQQQQQQQQQPVPPTASTIRLICAGRILQPDNALITQFNLNEESAVHVVRSNNSSNSGSQVTLPTSPSPATRLPSLQQQQQRMDPFGMDPQLMQQMMQSPLMQSITSNPELMRQIMLSNPQMQQVIRDNPEIGQLLNDDRFLQQMLEVSRNPVMMQEMMRNTDRALVNIENMPGGFEALRRLYTTVEAPLREGENATTTRTTTTTTSGGVSSSDGSGDAAARAEEERNRRLAESLGVTPIPEQHVNDQPLPNPWTTPASAAARSANNNFPNIPFGSAAPLNNLFGGLFPPLPLQPAQQQSTQQQSSDLFSSILNNNPAFMQQMMQQQINPAARSNNSQQQNTAAPGTRNPNPFILNPFMNFPGGDGVPLMFPGMFGGNPPLQPSPLPTAVANTASQLESPETRFASQLEQLEGMGFVDKQKNISALLAAGGNVNSAIEYLLSQL